MLNWILLNNNNNDTIFNINDTKSMENINKNIKIDNYINTMKFNIALGKRNKKVIKDRYSSTLMIKEVGRTIYQKDGQSYVCDQNNVIFIPKHCNYKFQIKESGYCYQINFDTDEKIDNIRVFHVNGEKALSYFKLSQMEYSKDPTNTVKLYSILYNLLNLLLEDEISDNNSYLTSAINIIHENLSDTKLDNEFIANKINISEVYLRKLFVTKLKATPKQYIIKLRMEKAVSLLSENNSVKNTASSVGYDSVYSFSRAFKNYFNKSPKQYFK